MGRNGESGFTSQSQPQRCVLPQRPGKVNNVEQCSRLVELNDDKESFPNHLTFANCNQTDFTTITR